MDLLTEEQLDALRRELRDSQAAQNWAPGSTRSQWADDLATAHHALTDHQHTGEVYAAFLTLLAEKLGAV